MKRNVADVGEMVAGLGMSEGVDDVAEGVASGVDASGGGGSEQGLSLAHASSIGCVPGLEDGRRSSP